MSSDWQKAKRIPVRSTPSGEDDCCDGIKINRSQIPSGYNDSSSRERSYNRQKSKRIPVRLIPSGEDDSSDGMKMLNSKRSNQGSECQISGDDDIDKKSNITQEVVDEQKLISVSLASGESDEAVAFPVERKAISPNEQSDDCEQSSSNHVTKI